MPIFKPRSRDGFALPAVLAVTGVVTLIFLVAMTALHSLTTEAASARARVRFLQRAMTAEAQIAFLAATQPMKPFGLSINDTRSAADLGDTSFEPRPLGLDVEQLWLDGRPYRLDMDQPLLVRLKDEAGMLNLTSLDMTTHQRFLQALGVEPRQVQGLIARYYDYMDTDDQRRADGAERADYGAAQPTNRRLMRPQEYLSILGMRESVDAKRWRRLAPDLTANGTNTAFNVNTASRTALALRLGLTEPQIDAVIRQREESPFQIQSQLQAVTGLVLGDQFETVLTFPSGAFYFNLHDSQSAWTYRGRIILTPVSAEQPIWIDQFALTEAPKRAAANINDAPRLPTPTR